MTAMEDGALRGRSEVTDKFSIEILELGLMWLLL